MTECPMPGCSNMQLEQRARAAPERSWGTLCAGGAVFQDRWRTRREGREHGSSWTFLLPRDKLNANFPAFRDSQISWDYTKLNGELTLMSNWVKPRHCSHTTLTLAHTPLSHSHTPCIHITLTLAHTMHTLAHSHTQSKRQPGSLLQKLGECKSACY